MLHHTKDYQFEKIVLAMSLIIPMQSVCLFKYKIAHINNDRGYLPPPANYHNFLFTVQKTSILSTKIGENP